MDVIDRIGEVCGHGGVLAGADLAARPGDWLGQTRCGAAAIVRPATTEQLARVMRICHERGQPVVAAGGLSGLVHGADASGDELQISFERMRSIGPVDVAQRTMIAEAGAPLQAVQEEAASHDLLYAVDLSARGSATIGGTISTNAGGNQVIRYGMTRENVLGLEAVLADGTVVSSMNRLLKNNTAYDLKQLFIGAEGTLGLVTRAVLRLHPKPMTTNTALLAVEGFDKLTEVFETAGDRLGLMLTSFEVMWNSHYEAIAVNSGRHQPPLPGGHDYYAIVEASGMDPDRDSMFFSDVMTDLLDKKVIADAVIPASEAQRMAIWAVREDVEGLMRALMPGAVFDVSLPIAKMERYVAQLEASVSREWGENAKTVVFGHLGDGNLHIGVAPRPWSDDAKRKAEEMVYRPLEAIDGSVSAEHGIGLDKKDWLGLSRSPAERDLMHSLKKALDPKDILNRGKIFAAEK